MDVQYVEVEEDGALGLLFCQLFISNEITGEMTLVCLCACSFLSHIYLFFPSSGIRLRTELLPGVQNNRKETTTRFQAFAGTTIS